MAEPEAIPIEHQLAVRGMFGGALTGEPARRIAAASRELLIPAGKVIYRAGERCAHVHFVLSGTVELSAEGEEPWIFEDRSLIGVLDAEQERQYSRTARAMTDVRLVMIRTEDWADIIEDNLELTIESLRTVHERILEMTLALAPGGGFRDAPERRSMLPMGPQPKRDPNPFERLLTLRLCRLFERAGTQTIIRLGRAARHRHVDAGEVFVRQGDAMDALLVVASGGVAFTRGEPALSARFGPADVVGGHVGVGLASWPATATALDPTVLLSIGYDELYDVMEDHFDLVRSLRADMSAQTDRLRHLLGPR
jgi:CRP-like cAMP-binding protein